MKVVLWGAGGHGAVVLDAIRQQGLHEPVAFLADDSSGAGQLSRSGMPVLVGREHLQTLRGSGVTGIIIAIGEAETRVTLAAIAVKAGFQLCTIVHPSAVVCRDVSVGDGTVVFAGSVVQTGSRIGSSAIINTGAVVDHDCVIGDGAQIGPGVTLGGRVTVGDITFIGVGASVIDRITIGRNCVIGAGAVVVRDVQDDVVAFGVPARAIRPRSMMP